MRAVIAVAATLASVAAFAQAPADGDTAKLVAARCTQCHELARVTGAGYSATDWHNVLDMMRNVGATFSDAEAATLVAYLAEHYPERARPAAVMVQGPARVEIAEWTVPSPGARPHDPLMSRDGALWYTGQFNNTLGRLDPRTGEFREYALKTPKSGPHGLIEDGRGRIWFTANSAAYVGALDPATGSVKEYPMPEADARDPHTPIFDAKGRLWFTVQGGNRIGRIDPATGEVKLVASLTRVRAPMA
jgi:virginiamycin B lyase